MAEEEENIEQEKQDKAAEDLALAEKEKAEKEKAEDELGEKEPTGNSPEAIFARKIWRRGRNAELRSEALHDENIRLEEQLKAAKEKPPETQAKIATPEEVQALVDTGTIKQAEATAYLLKVELDRREKEQEQREAQKKPIERALSEINEYRTYVPGLDDPANPQRAEIQREYNRLILERGYPANVVTQAEAVRAVLGPTQKLKERREMADLTRRGLVTHAETSLGGGSESRVALDLSKAPQGMKERWERSGDSEKSRREELRIYNELKQRQAARG